MSSVAGLDGATIQSNGARLLGGLYTAAGDTSRPTAVLIHGLPGLEQHLDIAYRLRDIGWNCLYFHFRGCWGSSGTYALSGLADDTRAAVDWVASHPTVDPERIALIGASAGAYPALRVAAQDPRVQTVIGISPLVEPAAFQFPRGLAEEFVQMLHGISADELLRQWGRLEPLQSLGHLATRPALMITAGGDTLFPPAHYSAFAERFPSVDWITDPAGDHGFSASRSWLVGSVANWLTSVVRT